MEGKDSEGRTSASAVESIDAKNGDKHQVDDDTEDEKRFDEDALPVPLEEVEMLTGGVDENDDRTVEFPWDEEARKARVAPRPIKFDENVTNLDCHPSENFVACAHIDGVASVHRFCLDETSSTAEEEEEDDDEKVTVTTEKGRHGEEVFSYLDYEDACRVVKFNRDGTKLITASAAKDVTFHDFQTEEVDFCLSNAHYDAVYAICILSESLFASGDDAGVIKLWDVRQRKSLFSFNDNTDFISSLLNGDSDESSTRRLLATSGDGTITNFNLRQRKIELKSEVFDTELLCAAPIRNRSKLVTGDGNGVCNIFNWDEWGYFADKFPVCAGSSLDAMVGVTDNIVAVAGLSGTINAIHFNPNRHLGKLGSHLISAADAVADEDEGEEGGSGAGGSGSDRNGGAPTSSKAPIDSLALNHDGTILASCGHDNRVRFWSVAHLAEVDPEKLPRRKKESSKRAQLNPDAKKSAFYHDLAGYDKVEAEGDEDEDDSDDNDDDDNDSDGDDDSDPKDDNQRTGTKSKLSVIREDEEDDDSSDDDSDSSPPPKKKHK